MIDRSLKYRRAGRSAELRLFRGEQTVLNTRSLQTAECRFRIGQSRQFDRAHISSGLTRETDISQVPALRCRRHVSKRQDRKAAYDALCRAGGNTARNSKPCRLIVGHIPKWLPPNTLRRRSNSSLGMSRGMSQIAR